MQNTNLEGGEIPLFSYAHVEKTRHYFQWTDTNLFLYHKLLFCSLSWIKVNGSVYKQGSVVLGMEDGMPTFGIIEDIVVFCTDMFYLVCSILFTECFSHHFHAFQVHNISLICTPTLYDTYVLAAYSVRSHLYVMLKYQLIE